MTIEELTMIDKRNKTIALQNARRAEEQKLAHAGAELLTDEEIEDMLCSREFMLGMSGKPLWWYKGHTYTRDEIRRKIFGDNYKFVYEFNTTSHGRIRCEIPVGEKPNYTRLYTEVT